MRYRHLLVGLVIILIGGLDHPGSGALGAAENTALGHR